MEKIKNELNIVLDYIEKLEQYTFWIEFEDFLDNSEKYDACCMVLQQIWEVTWKLDESDFSDLPIKEMRWMRNRITHNYLWIDDSIIWDTIKENIPELKIKIKVILSNI